MGESTIIEILKLGISGLVFLLAALAFSLLAKEQKKANPNAKVLKTIHLYAWQGIVLALIVAGYSLAEIVLKGNNGSSMNQSLVANCRDSLERLDTHSKLSDVNVNDLKNVIEVHYQTCKAILAAPQDKKEK